MSLEATIQENTNAIRELIKALASGVPTTAAQVAAVVAEAPVQETKPEAKKQKAAASQEQPIQTAAASSETSSSATPEVKAETTYQEAAAAVLELSKVKGRDAALGVLSSFGVANLKEVKAEQYGAVLAAATNALGG